MTAPDRLHPARRLDVAVEEIALGLDDATFVGGRHEPVHRWYKLRPSFSPRLVRCLLDRLGGGRRLVLDPFAGAATTLVEAARLGRRSLGVEINPFLAAYANRALDWSAPPAAVRAAHTEIAARLRPVLARAARLGLPWVRAELGVEPPPIHNVFRWWRADVLAQLLAAKAVLRDAPDPLGRRLLWLALATVCIDVANVKRMHPTLTFHDRGAEPINVRGLLRSKLAAVADDLAALGPRPRTAEVVEGNSRALDAVLPRPVLADVVTSPPYCNRYSYVWETRPHLYLMDLVTEAGTSARLDLEGVGGTWGSATSTLLRGTVAPRSALLARLLAPVVRVLRPADNLMANYALKYFNQMDEHFDALGRVLRPGSRFAYVVGNSRLKGVDVPTEATLTRLLQAKPWCRVDYVLVFRRRIGRRSLYESAIIGRVPAL